MSSEVDICNLALARLGEAATLSSIDPPEGSAHAEHAARFFPMARDTMLEKHAWKFSKRRAQLALLDTPSWEWAYAYAEPANALRILSVLPATGAESSESADFTTIGSEDGNGLILTNLESATAIYTVRITDTTKFSPLFIEALSWWVASYMAGPLIKGQNGMDVGKTCMQFAMAVISGAATSDANQKKTRPEHVPGWIAAR